MLTLLWPRFLAQRRAIAGLATLVVLVLLSLLAPAIAPQNPGDPLGFDPAAAHRPPSLSWTYLLGADERGRSVLALLLWGGRTSLAIGLGAALLSALAGLALGALWCRHGGVLPVILPALADLGQAAPPLVVLVLLAARNQGVDAPALLAVLVATGWAAPARLTRTALTRALAAPYVDAARALGLAGPSLAARYLLPEAIAPVAAWAAGAAAAYLALEAGLGFLGLGLPRDTVSWGTALAGAQDALAGGNWWWMLGGGLALAAATLALDALARGLTRALDPLAALPAGRATIDVARVHDEQAPPALAPPELAAPELAPPEPAPPEPAPPGPPGTWVDWRKVPAGESRWRRALRMRPRRGPAFLPVVAVLLCGAVAATAAFGAPSRRPLPDGDTLLGQAVRYQERRGQHWAYIATATYAATAAAVRGKGLPWAAYGPCRPPLRGTRCASSDVQVWYSDGHGRVQMEGSIFVCTPRATWGLNPMAGLALADRRGCTPLGPAIDGLGTTADTIRNLLPTFDTVRVRTAGADAVAGRHCWVVALPPSGATCLDTTTGLPLRVERRDLKGRITALYSVTAISYDLDLAPEIFANPIPGGHGPLVDGLSQPLLDLQSADDVALFSALVPGALPPGLTPLTPTFDSFYDDRHGYALAQRVRQAYVDRTGRVVLVLVETLPGSAWDATPGRAVPRQVTVSGHRLRAWQDTAAHRAVVRVEIEGTAAIVSSPTLPPATLEHIAAGLH